jgi:membrane protein implicated in regulation of membrane protease activity
MLMVYLIALIVGGVLLATTLVLGGAVEHDADAGGDADHGGDASSDHASALDAALAWLPVTSLRFWTFFAAFFGGVGTVLSAWNLAGPVPAAVVAIAGGWLSGLIMDRSMRYLRRADSDSSLGGKDVVGAGAEVLVPVAAGTSGKVRVRLKGRSVDLLAETEDDQALAAGQHVMVLSMRDDGHVLVTRGDKLDNSDGRE